MSSRMSTRSRRSAPRTSATPGSSSSKPSSATCGASTAAAFIKTFDPGSGYATTNFITVDMTDDPDHLGRLFDSITIDAAWSASSCSSASPTPRPCSRLGVFYDNLVFRPGRPVRRARRSRSRRTPCWTRTSRTRSTPRRGSTSPGSAAPVEISVFDLAGRRIATLRRASSPPATTSDLGRRTADGASARRGPVPVRAEDPARDSSRAAWSCEVDAPLAGSGRTGPRRSRGGDARIQRKRARPWPPHRARTCPGRRSAASSSWTARPHYRIAAYDRLDPFLMSLPSDTDLWMFVASGGGLTAGRVDPDGEPVPLRDRRRAPRRPPSHRAGDAGPRLRAADGAAMRWEPFAEAGAEDRAVERNLYKNVARQPPRLRGDRPRPGPRLPLPLGGLRRVRLGAHRRRSRTAAPRPCALDLLDGLRNVLPFGAPLALYQQASNLVDAYKKSEVDPETGLGIFSLTAGITDRAEALEVAAREHRLVLRPRGPAVHLSPRPSTAFRRGRVLPGRRVLNGARGNYLVSARLDAGARRVRALAPGRRRRPRPRAGRRPAASPARGRRSRAAARRGAAPTPDENLRRNVASADGLQLTGARRGLGPPLRRTCCSTACAAGSSRATTRCPAADFADFVRTRNREVAARHAAGSPRCPATLTVGELRAAARRDRRRRPRAARATSTCRCTSAGATATPAAPGTASRSACATPRAARAALRGQLARHLPELGGAGVCLSRSSCPNMVAKFVNASTVDGFNPYRITRDGVDWEVHLARRPLEQHRLLGRPPDRLPAEVARVAGTPRARRARRGCSARAIFSYAEVPYRLKPYAEHPGEPARHHRLRRRARRARSQARVAARRHRRQAGARRRRRDPPREPAREAAGAGAVEAVEPRPRRRDLDEHAAARVERRQQRARRRRRLGGHALPPAPLPGVPRRTGSRPPATQDVAGRRPRSPTWFDGGRERVCRTEQACSRAAGLDARDRKRMLDALGGAFSDYREAVYARGLPGKTRLPCRRGVPTLCRTALRASTTASRPTAARTASTTPTTCWSSRPTGRGRGAAACR